MKTVEGEEAAYDNKLPFSAQIFKTIADPYVGKLSLFKVVTGSLSGTMELLNSTQDKKEKSIISIRCLEKTTGYR